MTEGKKSVVLHFSFMEKLRVITVEGYQGNKKCTEQLLVKLFPGDEGMHSPNAANAEALPSGTTSWEAQLPGRPFKWAQWLGGLTFLRSDPEGHCGTSTITQEPFWKVIDRIREVLA